MEPVIHIFLQNKVNEKKNYILNAITKKKKQNWSQKSQQDIQREQQKADKSWHFWENIFLENRLAIMKEKKTKRGRNLQNQAKPNPFYH